MSDLGFDTVALAGGDAVAPSHPWEMARELIASSEVWSAEGDPLRAQQALLGAARLVPEDPEPWVRLAELLRKEGQHDKAERVLAKAEALSEAPPRLSDAEAQHGDGAEEYVDDLIAAAELEERRARVPFKPTKVAIALAVMIGVAGVVFGIAQVTKTDEGLLAARPVDPVETVAEPDAEPVPEPMVFVEPAAAPVGEPERIEVEPLAPLEEEVEPVAVEPFVEEPAEVVEPALPVVPVIAKKRTPSRAARNAPKATTRVLPLSSTDKVALTQQGDALYARGQTGLAATYYRRALEADPDYAPALVGVGRSILRAEKYDEAFQNSTRALELARGVDARPGLEAEAIYQLGRVHLHRGDLDAARRLFRQATASPGGPSEAWFYLGEALWNDNSPAAREAYETYLERVPDGHLAERARKAIQ